MKRWLSGDERTLGAVLVLGVLTMAFFRLDEVRDLVGTPAEPLGLVLVAVALAWWSLLPRSFVWLDPAVLTWRDTGDRGAVVTARLAGGWVFRQLLLGYLLALLLAAARAPAAWAYAGAGVLVAAGLLAFGVVRRPRAVPWPETAVVLAVAGFAVVVRPGPAALVALAAVLLVAAAPLVRFGRPPVADAGRPALVDGWRDRVSRVSGVHFLDLALLLPVARPVRPRPLTSGLRLAWVGVLGRTRHLPTAALLALTAIAARGALPGLPADVVFAVLGYLAVAPLVAGLGELWRSSGRRRWVGLSNTALRVDHLVVAVLLTVCWAVPVWLLATWPPQVLLTVPVVAACVVRTMTRPPPTFDNLVQVDSPMGAVPMRLVLQTTRGPDLGVVALVLLPALPLWGAAPLVVAVLAVAVCR